MGGYASDEDPYYTDLKRDKKHMARLEFVADSDYGIPKQCPCGREIIIEASNGIRYFTCKEYKNDGLHRRTRWDKAMEEEVEKLNTELAKLRDFVNRLGSS